MENGMDDGIQTSKVGFSLSGRHLAGMAVGAGGLFGGGWVSTVKKGNLAERMDGPGGDSGRERREKLAARRGGNHKEDRGIYDTSSFGKTSENSLLLSKVWS